MDFCLQSEQQVFQYLNELHGVGSTKPDNYLMVLVSRSLGAVGHCPTHDYICPTHDYIDGRLVNPLMMLRDWSL